MKPMLSVPLPKGCAPNTYINSAGWMVQQKLDGERLLITVKDREPTGYNRSGDVVGIPTAVAANFDKKVFEGDWVFDGELLGDTYYVFDCVQAQNTIQSTTPHEYRFGFLISLVAKWNAVNLTIVPHAFGADKKKFFDQCRDSNVEGVIFKNQRGRYIPGSRSGDTVKCKFVTACEVFVTEVERDGKPQSVGTGLYHYGQIKDAGGCKIPEELIGRINEGDVIEVEYLYCMPSFKLYQPVWRKPRFDKSAEECTTDQLKFTSKVAVQ